MRALAVASSGFMAVAQSILVRFIVLGLNLITGIVSARFLGPTGRAEQAGILIGIGLFPFVLSFGIPVAIQYKLRVDPERSDRLVSAATILSVAFGVLSLLAGFLILPRLVSRYSPFVLHWSQLFLVLAPFAILYTVFCGVLQARNRFAEANFTRYAMPLSTLIALAALAAAHRLTPVTSSVAYVVPYLWVAVWLWLQVRPKLTPHGFRESASALLSYGSRSYITDILGTLAAQVDQVLVIALLSPVSMGFYAVALSAARVSDLISNPIVFVLFPKASALPAKQIAELTARVTRLTVVLLFFCMLLSIAALPLLLPAFYGRSFLASTPIAQVLVVSFVLSGAVYVLSQAYMAAGRPGFIALIQVLGLATTVPLMLVLVPRFQLMGAAWALVISSGVRMMLSLAGFPIILKTRIPSLILTREDLSFLKRGLKTGLSRQPPNLER